MVLLNAGDRCRGEKGFTLIELLIVVVIIGILGATAIPAYIGAQEKARRENLLKSAKSAESEISHWLNSALKGASAGTLSALLVEVDTNRDMILSPADMTNAELFNLLGSADMSVATQYAAARSTELSPWANMGNCSSTTTLFTYNAVDPGVGAAGQACTIQLSPAQGSGGNRIAIIATSNGPGGTNTANADLLSRMVVAAE